MEEAAEASGQTEVVRNPRIVNVLRGGILYVKIVKSLEETEDGIPARASQVPMSHHATCCESVSSLQKTHASCLY